MSRIASIFKSGHKVLIAYLTAGYPSLELTFEAATVLARSGCDILELGIPFSDPLADGATIQKASYEALKQGVTPKDCLVLAEKLSPKVDMPLVFMSYYNPLLRFGLEEFSRAMARAGVSGLIVPDLPPEEGEDLEASSRRYGLDLIYLLTPASTAERISLVAERSQGFIYLVSLTGVTGARESLPAALEDFVWRVRAKTTKPLCVGFGVSNPEQAGRVARIADGVIIGSRLIQLVDEDTTLATLGSFTLSLREVLDHCH